MAKGSKAGDRFTGAFLEELGKWSARLLIAAAIALASGFIILPH
jgi:hypothetical protein